MRIGGVVHHGFMVGASWAGALLIAAALSPSSVSAVGGSDTNGCYVFSDSNAPLDANDTAVLFTRPTMPNVPSIDLAQSGLGRVQKAGAYR